MPLVTLLVVIGIICLLFWANNKYTSPPILRTVFNVALVIITVCVLFSLLGWINIRV